MKWTDVVFTDIETRAVKDKVKFSYSGKPFKFQIPRGISHYGLSNFKSINVEIGQLEFNEWWTSLERHLCAAEPFKSNLSNGSLRIKMDDKTLVFNQDKILTFPSMEEGVFKGQEMSFQIEIDGTYFFNDVYGLVVRATQVVYYGSELSKPAEVPSCAFLDD